MSTNIKFNIHNKKFIELPIKKPTMGNQAIDIRNIGKENFFSYDPGFTVTASCKSKITFIDGEQGSLLYRGYPIEQLAEKKDFLDVSYLLLHGELPNFKEKQSFIHLINKHTMIHKMVNKFLHGFSRTAHPMSMMISIIGSMSSIYYKSIDSYTEYDRYTDAIRLIAKMPTLAAMIYKYSIGHPYIYPINNMSYSENFLNMMFGTPCENINIDPIISDAMDIIFILHADHEQNASTSTVRLVGSTGSNPFACISSGISALWGPLHGGANEECIKMLREIGNIKRIKHYLKLAKDKNHPFRLMGFGHRIYKNYDPRAKVMKETCHRVLEVSGKKNMPLFILAKELEKIALEDDYFIQKKLYPNIDFYSGITLNAIGIPTNMYTVIFAIARTVGWMSHLIEMIKDKSKIGRPRQLYIGETLRHIK